MKRFGDDILCKLMEGNYAVSTVAMNQSAIFLSSIDNLTFAASENKPFRLSAEQTKPSSQFKTENVNLSKRGSEAVALKVYYWFDDYKNLDTIETLSLSQVKDLVDQGKVANIRSCSPELEIIWEDLDKGPYFGNGRDLRHEHRQADNNGTS